MCSKMWCGRNEECADTECETFDKLLQFDFFHERQKWIDRRTNEWMKDKIYFKINIFPFLVLNINTLRTVHINFLPYADYRECNFFAVSLCVIIDIMEEKFLYLYYCNFSNCFTCIAQNKNHSRCFFVRCSK